MRRVLDSWDDLPQENDDYFVCGEVDKSVIVEGFANNVHAFDTEVRRLIKIAEKQEVKRAKNSDVEVSRKEYAGEEGITTVDYANQYVKTLLAHSNWFVMYIRWEVDMAEQEPCDEDKLHWLIMELVHLRTEAEDHIRSTFSKVGHSCSPDTVDASPDKRVSLLRQGSSATKGIGGTLDDDERRQLVRNLITAFKKFNLKA